MEESLMKVVEQIFSNWTALKLAVEHSMGGANSKQRAIDSIKQVVQYLVMENGVEREDVEDILEDIMDSEFNTLCEDGSIKEVASILFNFYRLLQLNDLQQCELEYSKIPPLQCWIQQSVTTTFEVSHEEIKPSTENNPASHPDMQTDFMDPEWTTVTGRRKR